MGAPIARQIANIGGQIVGRIARLLRPLGGEWMRRGQIGGRIGGQICGQIGGQSMVKSVVKFDCQTVDRWRSTARTRAASPP